MLLPLLLLLLLMLLMLFVVCCLLLLLLSCLEVYFFRPSFSVLSFVLFSCFPCIVHAEFIFVRVADVLFALLLLLLWFMLLLLLLLLLRLLLLCCCWVFFVFLFPIFRFCFISLSPVKNLTHLPLTHSQDMVAWIS